MGERMQGTSVYEQCEPRVSPNHFQTTANGRPALPVRRLLWRKDPAMMLRHELTRYWIGPERRFHCWPRAQTSATQMSAGSDQPVPPHRLRQGHRKSVWRDELAPDWMATVQADIASSSQTPSGALLHRPHRPRERWAKRPKASQ